MENSSYKIQIKVFIFGHFCTLKDTNLFVVLLYSNE